MHLQSITATIQPGYNIGMCLYGFKLERITHFTKNLSCVYILLNFMRLLFSEEYKVCTCRLVVSEQKCIHGHSFNSSLKKSCM